MSGSIPIVMTAAGRQPTPPATLRAQLVALAQQYAPGLTANLPGALIEDIASTGTAAVVLSDQAVTETINSLTPLGANQFLLLQLGAIYGTIQGQQSNPSVYVVFSGAWTVTAGTYNSGTGAVSLTTSTPHALLSGDVFSLSSMAGTGSVAALDGTWTATGGTTGSTITFTAPTSLTLTITGGEASSNATGFTVPAGFTVSDSGHQYTVQDGGTIGSSGSTPPLFCLATITGTWTIPADTVTTIATALPAGVNITVNNPTAGLPGGPAQSEASYRSQVLQDGLAVAQGMTTMLKAQLARIPGVQPNLISVRFKPLVGYEVIVGGGDPYAVANAIFEGVGDLTDLTGSVIEVTGITRANPGIVTTDLNHGLAAGDSVVISGVDPAQFNNGGTAWVIPSSPAVTNHTFPIGDTSGFPSAYVSGGVISPNNRNVTVGIYDAPDTYEITFVNPPQQLVTLNVTYASSSPNIVSNAAVASSAAPALQAYVNGITVGQPMLLNLLKQTFTLAVADLIPPDQLTEINFAVTIAGVSTPPEMGTEIIQGDVESYFYCTLSMISIQAA